MSSNDKKILGGQYKLLLRSNNICQGKVPLPSDFSFEKGSVSWDWSIWAPHSFESGSLSIQYFTEKISPPQTQAYDSSKLEALYDQELAKIKSNPQPIPIHTTQLFKKYGFQHQLDHKAHPGVKRSLAKEPPQKVRKVLKHIHKKMSKGWKPRDFWAYFIYTIKQEDTTTFPKMLAGIYRDAIDGKDTPQTKRLRGGVTSGQFIDTCQQLEKATGEKLSVDTLERLVCMKGKAQVWLESINAVIFRRKLDRKGKKQKKRAVYEIQEKKRWVTTNSGKRVVSTYQERVRVGDEIVPDEDGTNKSPEKNVSSWVGLFVHTVKRGSVEAIRQAFYTKRKEKPSGPVLKETPLKMEDFDFSEEGCLA